MAAVMFVCGLGLGMCLAVWLALRWAESEEGRRASALADAERRVREVQISALRDMAAGVETFRAGAQAAGFDVERWAGGTPPGFIDGEVVSGEEHDHDGASS